MAATKKKKTARAVPTACPKCGGLTVRQIAVDTVSGMTGLEDHCMNCGKKTPVGRVTPLVKYEKRHDPTVAVSEARQQKAAKAQPKPRFIPDMPAGYMKPLAGALKTKRGGDAV